MIATKDDFKTKKGIIYIIKNKINWKRYIGQSKRTFAERYNVIKWWTKIENVYLNNSINKYGHENFDVEILMENLNQEQLDYWETFYINYFQSDSRRCGYNLLNGGKESRKYSEGLKEGYKSGMYKKRGPKGIKVVQINPETNEIVNTFNSLASAARYIGDETKSKRICYSCKTQYHACGYKWEYLSN
ncbi:MAG: hypothetical protein AABY22_22520, partial [Nanoarchaeota archaeon]